MLRSINFARVFNNTLTIRSLEINGKNVYFHDCVVKDESPGALKPLMVKLDDC